LRAVQVELLALAQRAHRIGLRLVTRRSRRHLRRRRSDCRRGGRLRLGLRASWLGVAQPRERAQTEHADHDAERAYAGAFEHRRRYRPATGSGCGADG
jgi:hypothetical protein